MSRNEADFIFLGDLDWFFGSHHSGRTLHLTFEDHQSVKHLIEACGIPHVEVGRILVNGEVVGFNYLPHNGDQVEAHPQLPHTPAQPYFLLDNHLGRLTALLRMLGFDCLYHNDFEDAEMAGILETDERILLTRDRQLLMRKAVRVGYCLRSLVPQEQLKEVMQRFQLAHLARPFTRCLRCNGILQPVEKAEILDLLEPKTKLYYETFSRCPDCGQIYWQGSHWEQMKTLIEEMGDE